MSLQPILNEAEVVSLFSHPLASFLSEDAPFPLEPGSSIAYHSYRDLDDWAPAGPPEGAPARRKVRMHRFLTGREVGSSNAIKPVYGLTSAILIGVAIVGYARDPAFDMFAPGQLDMQQRIENAFKWGKAAIREARWREGVVYSGEEADYKRWETVDVKTTPPREKPWRLLKGILAKSRL